MDYELVQRILWHLRSLPTWPVDFPFTSVQVNTGATRVHVDKPNVGLSCTFSLGSFDHGELWMDGEVIDTFANPFIFDGKIPHATMPFEGHRIAIVAFTHGLAFQLSDADFSWMHEMGFNPMPRDDIQALDLLLMNNGVAADM